MSAPNLFERVAPTRLAQLLLDSGARRFSGVVRVDALLDVQVQSFIREANAKAPVRGVVSITGYSVALQDERIERLAREMFHRSLVEAEFHDPVLPLTVSFLSCQGQDGRERLYYFEVVDQTELPLKDSKDLESEGI